MVETLYAQPLSLAIGAICGVIASATAAWLSEEKAIWYATGLLAAIGLIRFIMSICLVSKQEEETAKQHEMLFEIGAFSYSAMLGLITAMAFWYNAPPQVQTLMAVNAVGYGVGICARNAGRPAIAIGQLLFSILPLTLTVLLIGSLSFFVLAITLILLVPAMVMICRKLFDLLRESVESAEENALLAEQMNQLAHTDVVTNLANRAGLNRDLAALAKQRPDTHKIALFWFDLDRFKEVNDVFGHQAGDRILAKTAQRLTDIAPNGATIARFGGDEFVVAAIVPDKAAIDTLASQFQEELERPLRLEGKRLHIGTSLGIAMMPDDGKNTDTLMQCADLALYHAKVNGRGRTSFFDASMTRKLINRKEIETELRQAIQRDELSVFYQPIVDLETGRIRAFEALVRWFHPIKGELRPDQFITVAEETGVIITLGNWITSQAAKACASWPEDVNVAVNLSPAQIKAPGAALGIMNALREARLAPSRLELEVTESLFLDESNQTAQFIKELHGQGVRFALDDFGTGYSSLGYINKFPFKKIKVDRSFVSTMGTGRKSSAIIRAVAEMGATLGMDIVAEGIETTEQVEAVRKAGCTHGQGFYFSRAVPDYLAAMLIAKWQGDDELHRLAM